MTVPEFQQAFAIGSSLQYITVPEGATRLFLGLNDVYEWINNIGFRDVTVTTIVDIDIKPGSDPNPINQGSNGLIPVAIFSSPCFDATTVDSTIVELGGASVAVRGKGKSMAHKEDVDGDVCLTLWCR